MEYDLSDTSPHASYFPNAYTTAHARWAAVSNRNPASHFAFLYGVKSTKIYCRPTCSARLARRANIIFYDNQTDALQDGFRACKRCRPDDPSFLGETEQVVNRILNLLREKMQDNTFVKAGVKDLAAQVNVTPSYLCRVFKKTMGVTIGAYMREFERPADAPAGPLTTSHCSPGMAVSSTVPNEHPETPSVVSSHEMESQWAASDVSYLRTDAPLDFDADLSSWLWSSGFPDGGSYAESLEYDFLSQ